MLEPLSRQLTLYAMPRGIEFSAVFNLAAAFDPLLRVLEPLMPPSTCTRYPLVTTLLGLLSPGLYPSPWPQSPPPPPVSPPAASVSDWTAGRQSQCALSGSVSSGEGLWGLLSDLHS